MKRLIVVLVSLAAASALGAAENQGAPAASPDSAAVASGVGPAGSVVVASGFSRTDG